MVDRSWYLIHTKPKQERTAKENLERQSYETFLPLIKVRKRRLARAYYAVEPLFPRYCFIALSDSEDNWSPIRSTRGVASLVRFGGVPAKVPAEFIVYLQGREAELLRDDAAMAHFSEGDRVAVVEGPMAGCEGIFEADSSVNRVTILLDIVGKHTRVELDPQMLDKL